MRQTGRGSPSDPGSGGSGGGDDTGDIHNLNLGNGGAGNPGDDEPPSHSGQQRNRNTDDDKHDREFRLVNPRNVNVNVFNGKDLVSNRYMALNKSIRRLILAQGSDGPTLLKILDYVETFGIKKFIDTHFSNLIRQCNKAGELDRAIKGALLNWTVGIANGVVKCGTEGGLHAWRKVYNKYMPLAHNMQHILIRELMSLKPVGAADIDQFFYDVERICDLYVKVGSKEDPNFNKWVKACVLQNLPDIVVTTLALQMKHAESA